MLPCFQLHDFVSLSLICRNSIHRNSVHWNRCFYHGVGLQAKLIDRWTWKSVFKLLSTVVAVVYCTTGHVTSGHSQTEWPAVSGHWSLVTVVCRYVFNARLQISWAQTPETRTTQLTLCTLIVTAHLLSQTCFLSYRRSYEGQWGHVFPTRPICYPK